MDKSKQERHKNLFKDIVLRFAEESHCESFKVAAIAVNDGRIIATGINGSPKSSVNCDDYFKHLHNISKPDILYEEWKKSEDWREIHHKWSDVHEIHAEQSLICEAARNGMALNETDIYISHEPCIHCSKLLIGIRPRNIYFVHRYDKSDFDSRILIKEQAINIEQI